MGQTFEVTWTDEVDAPPEAVWDAITRHPDGWLWPIAYEPRVGGVESGLTPDGGTVTAWEPERHFSTTGAMAGGTNRIDYRLTPSADGLHRIYGRDRWGWPVGIAHHLYAPAETRRDERETA